MPKSNDNKNIIALYFIFMSAILMNFVPSISIQSWGGVLFFASFIATYIAKWTSEKQSFKHIHYTYITKTIWVFSLFSIIATVIAYFLGDHAIIERLVKSIQSGTIPTNNSLMQVIVDYGKSNLILFLSIFLPTILYVLFRLAKGMHHARKNLTPSIKNWF